MTTIKFPKKVKIRILDNGIYRVYDPTGDYEEFEDCEEANEEALLLVEEAEQKEKG